MPHTRSQDTKGKKAAPAGANRKRAASPPAGSPILELQRAAGNTAVARLMRSGLPERDLEVSRPGDAREQEAERMAEAAVSHSSEEIVDAGVASQRTPDTAPSMVGDLGPGRPLDPESRSLLEP